MLASHPSDPEPLQSAYPVAHAYPHVPAMQVADAPTMTGHGTHAVPHVAVALLDTHVPPQAWKPALQVTPQALPLHEAEPFAGVAQGEHDAPHVVTEVSLTHDDPQR